MLVGITRTSSNKGEAMQGDTCSLVLLLRSESKAQGGHHPSQNFVIVAKARQEHWRALKWKILRVREFQCACQLDKLLPHEQMSESPDQIDTEKSAPDANV